MSIGTQSGYGREKGGDPRRRPAPLYSGEAPPGAHAEGLVNLMRENHWSANPGAGHERGIDSLITRTAGDVGKLNQPSPHRPTHQSTHEQRVSSSDWNKKSKQGKKTVMARHGSGDL